jgi:nitroreductase
MLKTASLAIVICAFPDVQEGIAAGFYPQDCAAATENILLQATELGLGTCWCGVYPNAHIIAPVREIFGIAENVVPINIIAVGVPDEQPLARGMYREEKVRWIR